MTSLCHLSVFHLCKITSIRPYLSNASTAQLFSLCQTLPLRCKYCPVIIASIRPYLSNASTAQLFSLCQTIPPRCQYCPVIYPLSVHTFQMPVLPGYLASIRPYLSDAGPAQLVFISCHIQVSYTILPSLAFHQLH